MKADVEKEMEQLVNEEPEMPAVVRETLDATYATIQSQAKRRQKKFGWKKAAAAACAFVIAGGLLLNNDEVRAKIQAFFSFEDRGIEQAMSNGFGQENPSTAVDQEIGITLQRSFADGNKLGLSFLVEFVKPSMLEAGISEVSMDFRVKNGDGEYIEEFIPDTKVLKGDGGYASGLEQNNPVLNEETGIVQYDVVFSSNRGSFPILKDAVLEVESINIFYEKGTLQKINGEWNLPIANQNDRNNNQSVEYVMADSSSGIQVLAAKADPTSFNLKFAVDQLFEDETPFVFAMKLMDDKGNEYRNDSFSMEAENGQTIISTNFPITSYDQFERVQIIIDSIGEVELLRK